MLLGIPQVGVGPKGATSAGFRETDIAGCRLWLRASASQITIATGVATWADLSAVGNNATQATGGNQPTWSASAINGKPAVVAGGGKYLTLAQEPVAQNAARSIYMVYGTNSSDTPGTSFIFKPRSAVGYMLGFFTGAGQAIETNNTTTNSKLSAAAPSGNLLLEWYFDGVTTNLYTLKSNGTALAVQNIAGTGVDVEGATAGCRIAESTYGPLAELVIYDSVLSAPNQALVRAELATYYGL